MVELRVGDKVIYYSDKNNPEETRTVESIRKTLDGRKHYRLKKMVNWSSPFAKYVGLSGRKPTYHWFEEGCILTEFMRI